MTFDEKNVLNINNGILALFHFYNGIEANSINFKEDLECIFSLYKNDYRYRNDENKYFLMRVSETMLDFEYLIDKDKAWRLEGTDDEPEGMQEFVQVYCDAYNASAEVYRYFEELYPNEFIDYNQKSIPFTGIDYNFQQKDPEKPKPEQETPKTFDECSLEIKKLEQSTPAQKDTALSKVNSAFTLSKALSKIDYIRIINALSELRCFQNDDGTYPAKKEVMKAFGNLANIDLSNYDKDLNKAFTASASLEANLSIFDKMKEKTQEIYLSKLNKPQK